MSDTGYSCHILVIVEFSQQVLENPKISNIMEISPLGAYLFHVDILMGKQTYGPIPVAARSKA